MAALVEDLSLFFDEFAVPATLVSGETIDVIFDRAFIEALGVQVDATQPMCMAQTTDVTANEIGFDTTVSIAASAFKVKSLRPDGTGLTTLMLEEA